MLLLFCPLLDFEFQPAIRVMCTRTEVHADAVNGVGMPSSYCTAEALCSKASGAYQGGGGEQSNLQLA